MSSCNPSSLKLARDFYPQFPTSEDLSIKHLFNFQLKFSQSHGIITWRITWYFFVYAEHPFDQPSPFIILLGWPFYNSKSSISNGSANPFGRKFTYLSNLKLSTKMTLGGSCPYCSPRRNLFPINLVEDKLARDPSLIEGLHSGSISPTQSRNPTLGPNLVPTLISTPVLAPGPALSSSNELFR